MSDGMRAGSVLLLCASLCRGSVSAVGVEFTIPDWLTPEGLEGKTVVIAPPSLHKPAVETVPMNFVTPIRGSVVYCNLAGVVEHSGIYIGNDRIVHRDGDGYLAIVSPNEFLARLEGRNPAECINVSCNTNGVPVGGEGVALRAESSLNNPQISKGYDLISKNCHQFCRYCLTGDAAESKSDFTFASLEKVMRRKLGVVQWRLWNWRHESGK